MPYSTLSAEVGRLTEAGRSDAFAKAFRDAVRDGIIQATELPSRFTLPKIFYRQGRQGTYERSTQDMVFEHTPEYEDWFANIDRELAGLRRYNDLKPILAIIQESLVDFEHLASATGQPPLPTYEQGETRSRSRTRAASVQKTPPKKKK
ncbi:hypothetical protein HNQ07_004080 [Deinococcus metalli]|uniref:Uncharacterized protein n=1 Tax=Deinococcus metalli TaxID=1141878 RepID=A0A7W8NT15_9DEIO|nr:hypothetical protein [Deinococcus metalli]MBB5378573.1 hypothetical protein [Deinococcus metalli]GHF58718.1 hypothetical protein GCM10017781_38760 [Deinococcus metalli]